MISVSQAIILGLLQGLTELFPVSSLGHSALLPLLLRWNIDQKSNFFLIFIVATHFATALVLFGFFFKDWIRIAKGFFVSLQRRAIDTKDAKLAWLLIIATIPAGVLGLLFEETFKSFFVSGKLIASALILNGCMLYLADIFGKRTNDVKTALQSDERISKLNWIAGVKIGLLQCLALIPGFSRTGATLTAGLLVGLSHEDSARFSFLLATPIIGAAAFLKLGELLNNNQTSQLSPILIGTVSAGIAAYISVRFLTKYFETQNLKPFALYCVIAGIIAFLLV